MNQNENSSKDAPGHPGHAPHWTSSKKDGVGTSISRGSLVWYTLSEGIINEVYYPRIDNANIRDFQFIITDKLGLFEEEKIDCEHEINIIEPGIPVYQIKNTSNQKKYVIEKTILTDPRKDALLLKVKFNPLKGKLDDYQMYAIFNPHIKTHGSNNDGWVADYKGIQMLYAQREDIVLAFTCSTPFINTSCGFYGVSDGWQLIKKENKLSPQYSRALNGNVVLTGEIDLRATEGVFIIVIGFGNNPAEAGQIARSTLFDDFDNIISEFKTPWLEFQQGCKDLSSGGTNKIDLYRLSIMVMKTHMDKRFSDGSIASLSIPWGFAKGDDDLGGYHLVWPRDLVETSGGLLAVGAKEEALQIMLYLMSTQDEDGHWPQNMWLDGNEYYHGIQMDETAFPILLANALKRERYLKNVPIWSTIKKAVGFLARNGPVSQQDRWEEDPGYSPFTLAVEIAALLLGAEFAREQGEHRIADYLIELADYWNSNIEKWTYVKDTDLSKKVGVEGYYVRIGPPDVADGTSPKNGYVPIKNRPPGESKAPFKYIVSPDALALVRFGLRAPDDPRIISTVKVIDSLLKTETDTGPLWHRYNEDGYGEHSNGDPFDGTGIGRGWPLLCGERAHYELAKGNIEQARELLKVIERQTGPGGLIPEQVWDDEDIPQKGLFKGHPAGSAMPLVWAHSEYVKLVRSIEENRIFDMPSQTEQRYIDERHPSNLNVWKFNHKCQQIKSGEILRIEVWAKAKIKWSTDDWKSYNETETKDTGLGIFYVDISTKELKVIIKLNFTFYWIDQKKWDESKYEVKIKSESN